MIPLTTCGAIPSAATRRLHHMYPTILWQGYHQGNSPTTTSVTERRRTTKFAHVFSVNWRRIVNDEARKWRIRVHPRRRAMQHCPPSRGPYGFAHAEASGTESQSRTRMAPGHTPYSFRLNVRNPSLRHRASRWDSLRSSRIISPTSSAKPISGSQPSLSRALIASPSRVSTSVRRK